MNLIKVSSLDSFKAEIPHFITTTSQGELTHVSGIALLNKEDVAQGFCIQKIRLCPML